MRVLHVTDTFLPKIGGAEIAIDQLVRAMNADGQECALLAQRSRAHADTEVAVDYSLRRFSRPRSALWAGPSIQRHLGNAEKELGRFDAFIGHHAFAPGYAVVKYARRTGRPSIVYPRGGDIYPSSRWRRKPLAWRSLRWALSNASAVVCASAPMEALVRQIAGDKAVEGRLTRIPNGVDVAGLRQDAGASRFAGDAKLAGPFILGLGRMVGRKGFDLLIDAFAALKTSEWKLVLAGEGRDDEALRRRAAPSGARIVFTGLVTDADKRWLLQNCRLMAAPSREESFGNVALEAMACGKPVIASRASGFAEIVRDGYNGRLVTIEKSQELRAALAEYQASSLSAESAHALETAQTFSWETIARQYSQLLARLA